MEVESSRNGIDIKHFTGEIQPRIKLALLRREVYSGEGDTTAGDELLLEPGPSRYPVLIRRQAAHQAIEPLLTEFRPTEIFSQGTSAENVPPQPVRQSVRPRAGDQLLGFAAESERSDSLTASSLESSQFTRSTAL